MVQSQMVPPMKAQIGPMQLLDKPLLLLALVVRCLTPVYPLQTSSLFDELADS